MTSSDDEFIGIAIARLSPAYSSYGPGILDARLGDRALYDIVFSNTCMMAVNFTLLVCNKPMITFITPPYGGYRWRAKPGEELFVPRFHALRVELSPDNQSSQLSLSSNVEFRKRQRRKCFVESFYWTKGVMYQKGALPLDPRDSHLLNIKV